MTTEPAPTGDPPASHLPWPHGSPGQVQLCRSGAPSAGKTELFGRVVRARNFSCLACQAERIATGRGTIRHDVGTDYERALSEFGTHHDLPANQRSAAEAIRRHAEHRQTSIASVHWLDYDDDRIRPVIVDFGMEPTAGSRGAGCATTPSMFLERRKRTASGRHGCQRTGARTAAVAGNAKWQRASARARRVSSSHSAPNAPTTANWSRTDVPLGRSTRATVRGESRERAHREARTCRFVRVAGSSTALFGTRCSGRERLRRGGRVCFRGRRYCSGRTRTLRCAAEPPRAMPSCR